MKNEMTAIKPILLLVILVIGIIACDKKEEQPIPTKEPKPIPPIVVVSYATNILSYEAIISGSITVRSKPLIDHGFIYSQSPISNIEDGFKTSLGASNSSIGITFNIKNLVKETIYYFKSYAITEDTIVLSAQLTFKTLSTNKWHQILSINFSGQLAGATFHADNESRQGFTINENSFTTPGVWFKSGNPIGTRHFPIFRFEPSTYTYKVSLSPSYNCPNYFRTFSIKDTIYFGLGSTNVIGEMRNDFWTYNVTTDKWKEAKKFPFEYQSRSASFSIKSNGYILAKENSTKKNMLFCYTPEFGKWESFEVPSELADYANWASSAFTIGDVGYVIMASDLTRKFELWRYNAESKQWTKCSKPPINFPQGYNNLFSLTTTTKSYIVFIAANSGAAKSVMYEYNSVADSWTLIGELPSLMLAGFVSNNNLYVNDRESLYLYEPE